MRDEYMIPQIPNACLAGEEDNLYRSLISPIPLPNRKFKRRETQIPKIHKSVECIFFQINK